MPWCGAPAAGRLVAAVALVLLTGLSAVRADDARPEPTDLPAHVATHHAITLGAGRLDYQAVAETLPIRIADGSVVASVYTIAYLVDPPPGQRRPVSFVFNGGPGAASVFLHLGALGPRILDTPATGAVPPPPVHLVDNPSTWLAFTDLVFVDPVGTGFSRGKGTGHDPDRAFWNVHADIASLESTVRLWLTRHQRWDAPIFLVGESYGGFRAATMAQGLERDSGVTVSGVVLISPALDLSVLHENRRDLIAAATELPSYAAAASVLAGATADLAGVEHYALTDYLVGLAGLKGEPAPGDPLVARVAHLTGLSEDIVRRHRARVPRRVFAREIRRGAGEVVSLYDATVTRPAASEGDEAGDAVLDPAIAAYTAAFEAYAPDGLGYRTDQPYRVLPHEVAQEWDWKGAEGGGYGLALSSLEAALLAHPQLKVLIVNGRYDLVTPYLGTRWLVDQLDLPPTVRSAIRLRVYEGGHMMYMRPQSRAALAQDAAALFASTDAAAPR